MSTSVPNPSVSNNPATLNLDSMDAAQIETLLSETEQNKAAVDYSAVKSRRVFASETSSSALQDLEMTNLNGRPSALNLRASLPQLPKPDSDQGAARQLAKDQQFYSNPEQLEKLYHQEFQRAYDDYSGAPLTPEQQSWLIYNHNNPKAALPDDPELQQIAENLNSQALAAVWKKQENVKLTPSWVPSENATEEYVLINYNTFTTALNSQSQSQGSAFTREQAYSMQHAYFHPESASPESLALLENSGVKSKANALLNERGMNLPSGVAPESSIYDNEVTDVYHAHYAQALQNYAATNKLSKSQEAQLEYQHYNPTASYGNRAELARMNQTLEESALNQTTQQYALPQGWKPLQNSTSDHDYDNLFQAEWQYNNEVLLQKQIDTNLGSLSSKDMADLRRAMADPQMERGNYSLAIQTKVEEIRNIAAQNVRLKHDLATDWMPTVSPIATTDRMGLGVLRLAEEAADTTLSFVQQIAPTLFLVPSIKNFFMTFSASITTARDNSFSQQVTDAGRHTSVVTAKADLRKQQTADQAENIKQYQKLEDDNKAAIAKSESKGDAMLGIMALGFAIALGTLATALSAGAAAPIAVALIGLAMGGCSFAGNIQQKVSGESFMTAMTKGIDDLPLLGKIGLAVVVLAMALCGSFGPAAGTSGAMLAGAAAQQFVPLLMTPLLVKYISLGLEEAGLGETASGMIGSILGTLLSMYLMYKSSSAKQQMPGGRETEGVMETAKEAINKATEQLDHWVQSSTNVGQEALRTVAAAIPKILLKLSSLILVLFMDIKTSAQTLEQTASTTVSITNNVAQKRQHEIQAEVILAKAFSQTEDTKYEEISNNFSKLAQAILDVQMNAVKVPKELSQLFTNMIRQYSQELGRLSNAI